MPELKTPLIKICGLTEPENAIGCVNLGADAIGLVFYEKSPRNVSIKRAVEISNALPDNVLIIGVFVNESFSNIIKTVNKCSLKGVQLHGNESVDLVNRLANENILVIKAFFATKEPYFKQAFKYEKASYFIVEYGRGALPGGNAEPWDYKLITGLKLEKPLALAGGLDPKNVATAIRNVKPAIVDVSSGVEKAFGIKDLNKVKSFIESVKTVCI